MLIRNLNYIQLDFMELMNILYLSQRSLVFWKCKYESYRFHQHTNDGIVSNDRLVLQESRNLFDRILLRLE